MIGDSHYVGVFQSTVFVADVLRIACLVGGAFIVGALFRLALIVRNSRQWGIYGSICVFSSAVLTEFDQLGHVPTIRLVLNVAGVAFSLVYIKKQYYHLQREKDLGRKNAQAMHDLEEEQLAEAEKLFRPDPKHQKD